VSLLIVEDNTISLRMLEVMLVSNGFEVVTAKTGRQALERLAERGDIQMVVTDLMMPEMDGLGLLEAMRANPVYKDLPVIVASSLNDADTVKRVVQLGCRNYLVKPLKEDVLVPKIRTLLGASNSAVKIGAMRLKFDVMRDNGFDVEQYDRLCDAFFAQAQGVVSSLAGAERLALDEPCAAAVLALRDGAAILTTGRLASILDRFRQTGACDVRDLKAVLDEVVAAMASAIDRRNRIKSRMDAGEASAG
jgi:CheY-like chemotaxis protein